LPKIDKCKSDFHNSNAHPVENIIFVTVKLHAIVWVLKI